jgi:uncharacterized protein (TIGR03435 family)
VLVGLPLIGWSAGVPALGAQASAKSTFTTVSMTRSDAFLNLNPADPVVARDRITWRAAPLFGLIRHAYEATVPTIEGRVPPEPLYALDATFPASTTPAEIRQMLRNLLLDRFALRVRSETRRMPIFRLTADPGGHKLGAGKQPRGPGGMPLPPGRVAVFSQGGWHFAGPRVTVRQIADGLADALRDRPVLDATGISGAFDVDVVQQAASAEAFLMAVPRQLGLRLEAATGSVDVLVIESFKMP